MLTNSWFSLLASAPLIRISLVKDTAILQPVQPPAPSMVSPLPTPMPSSTRNFSTSVSLVHPSLHCCHRLVQIFSPLAHPPEHYFSFTLSPAPTPSYLNSNSSLPHLQSTYHGSLQWPMCQRHSSQCKVLHVLDSIQHYQLVSHCFSSCRLSSGPEVLKYPWS